MNEMNEELRKKGIEAAAHGKEGRWGDYCAVIGKALAHEAFNAGQIKADKLLFRLPDRSIFGAWLEPALAIHLGKVLSEMIFPLATPEQMAAVQGDAKPEPVDQPKKRSGFITLLYDGKSNLVRAKNISRMLVVDGGAFTRVEGVGFEPFKCIQTPMEIHKLIEEVEG